MERSSRVGDALLEAKGEHGAMEAKLQVRLIDHCGSTFCKGQPLGRQLVTDAGWLHAVGPASAHLCAWIVCQILASPQDVHFSLRRWPLVPPLPPQWLGPHLCRP